MQIIKKIHEIFQQEKISLWLRPYEITILTPNSGIIEFIPNTLSMDIIKKKVNMSLYEFY